MSQTIETPSLSVIIAAHDEEASIARCVERVLAVFPDDCEILVVDGGSDGTERVVRAIAALRPQVRYVRNEGDRGKGHAIRVGVAHARASIMAQIDADLQFRPEELPLLIAPLLAGVADVALGTRFTPGAQHGPGGSPLFRTAGNRVVSAWASLLFRQRMTDVLAGMKAWTRDAIDRIGLRFDDFSYEIEIPVRALRSGLRVVDVPVTTMAREAGQSHVNVVRDGARILLDTTAVWMGLR